MSRFYRDRYKQIYEEIEPGLLRGVTDMTGARYIHDRTVSKTHWEQVRGPLVEVPDPWIPAAVKVLRVQDVVDRWENHLDQSGHIFGLDLLAEIKVALGRQLPDEHH